MLSFRLSTRLLSVPLHSARLVASRSSLPNHYQTRSFLASARLCTPTSHEDGLPAKKKRETKEKNSEAKTKVGRPTTSTEPKKMTITSEMLPPKRNQTSYMLYFSDFRSTRPRATNLETMTEMSRECSQSWATLSPSEKQVYKDKSTELGAEYQKNLAEWFKNTDPAVIREINKRRESKNKVPVTRPKDPNRPRKKNAFIFFFEEFRTNNEGRVSTLASSAGERWRAMSDAEKQPYRALAEKSLADYEISMAHYKPPN